MRRRSPDRHRVPWCSSCSINRDDAAFHRDAGRTTGVASRCRACRAAYDSTRSWKPRARIVVEVCTVSPRDQRRLSGPCFYCGDPADTIDHLIPRSRGGRHAIGNLVAACRSCNASKGPRCLSELLCGPGRATLAGQHLAARR